LKLGTESNGGFENIVLSDSTVYDTRLAAIALETVDGGTLERVSVRNIVVDKAGAAIFVRLGNRARPFRAEGPRPGIGTLRNVSISNVTAEGIGPVGCAISGIPQQPIQDIRLRDIRVTFVGGETAEAAGAEVPEHEDRYPEYNMFGQLPAYGFFARHVEGMSIRGMHLDYAEPDRRPALVFDDVRGLTLLDVDAAVEPQSACLMRTRGVAEALVQGCRFAGPVPRLLSAEQTTLTLMNNDLSNVETVLADPAAQEPSNTIVVTGNAGRP
jgi:hypothetical protein